MPAMFDGPISDRAGALRLRRELQALAAQRGVALSPPPEEPDNCCDSGCEAACVWETFYAEMGYWRDECLLRLED
ncbi:oxidoreductase family protein [Roseateles asaccharophilus]|uniref:Oxidoreductase family protein n=2 Tax=Roseateles asaccharophilus TaxID=582607 RepID=A0A4R6NCC3_9BURK|nr:oxidoreductase family protein [Roseateles asaccharophilus]